MATEIWLALISAVVVLATPIILAWSKLKFIEKNTADTSKKIDETHDLVNGHSMRMQEMYDLSLKQAEALAAAEKRLAQLEAYSQGKAEGKAEGKIDAESNAPTTGP